MQTRQMFGRMIVARVLASIALLSLALVFVGATEASAATPPTTSVLIPANGATLSGTAATLDASASNATSVGFLLFGGSYGYSGKVIGTATPTIYGWLYSWDTTTVPNTSYVLLSEAFNGTSSAFSAGVSITVNNNPTPTTSVLIPATGANLQARSVVLDATASGTSAADPVKSVQFLITPVGGTGYNTCSATPTLWGWICTLDTNFVAYSSGPYTVQSEALDSVGVYGYSAPVNVTINDILPSATIILPANGAVLTGPTNVFDAAFASSASAADPVGTINFVLTPVGGGANYCAGGCGAMPTIWGWIYIFPTAAAINGGLTPGSYTLSTQVFDQVGIQGYGPSINVTIN